MQTNYDGFTQLCSNVSCCQVPISKNSDSHEIILSFEVDFGRPDHRPSLFLPVSTFHTLDERTAVNENLNFGCYILETVAFTT